MPPAATAQQIAASIFHTKSCDSVFATCRQSTTGNALAEPFARLLMYLHDLSSAARPAASSRPEDLPGGLPAPVCTWGPGGRQCPAKRGITLDYFCVRITLSGTDAAILNELKPSRGFLQISAPGVELFIAEGATVLHVPRTWDIRADIHYSEWNYSKSVFKT